MLENSLTELRSNAKSEGSATETIASSNACLNWINKTIGVVK